MPRIANREVSAAVSSTSSGLAHGERLDNAGDAQQHGRSKDGDDKGRGPKDRLVCAWPACSAQSTTENRCEGITDTNGKHAGEIHNASPFQPQTARTPCEQVEMRQDDGSGIFRIDELAEKDVDRRSNGVDGEVARILCKGEDGEGNRESQGRKGRLRMTQVSNSNT